MLSFCHLVEVLRSDHNTELIPRHLCVSLEILLKLVRVFGSMIYSALSAQTPVGVDIEAEQRYMLPQYISMELTLNL